MIRHIIFDLDGTLVDTAPHCAGIINDMLSERGSPRSVSANDARNHLTRGGHQLVAALLGQECGDVAAELADFRARYVARPTPHDCLFPGVKDALVELAGLGVGLAVCSNKPQHLCEKTIGEFGLDWAISVIAGSRADRALKPAPDLALLALSALGADPGNCLYVGDSEVDRLTAEAAGLRFLFVSYGYAEPGWSPAGLATIDRFEDLVGLVREASAAGSDLPKVA